MVQLKEGDKAPDFELPDIDMCGRDGEEESGEQRVTRPHA